jgi:adenosyl cobinamide kinase/adenosyl cobinamide phosphate guanylyltransferase
MGKQLIFILGGARSGKSAYAQRLAEELGGDRVAFVATAEPGDDEMRSRIVTHRAERPAGWSTVEAPLLTGIELAAAVGDAPVVLFDCITLLVSNATIAAGKEVDAASAAAGRRHCSRHRGRCDLDRNQQRGWDKAALPPGRSPASARNQQIAAASPGAAMVAGLPESRDLT